MVKKLLSVLCLSAVCASTCMAQSMDTSLIARYDFTGNANDVSGHGYNATVSGATLTTDRYNQPNRAYNFNGSIGQYISAAVTTLPTGDSARTINVWLKWTGTPFINAAHGINWGNSNTGEMFGIGIYKNNNWFEISYDYPNGYDLASGIVADTNWHMITAIYQKPVMKIYVDGNLAASQNKVINTQLTDLFIGSRPDHASDCNFTGKIDDIRIYKRALPIAEIVAIYNPQLLVPGFEGNNPISVYPVPTSDYLYIRNAIQPSDVSVTDITGKKVAAYSKVKDGISLRNLTPGTYFIRITDGTVVSTHRIIRR